MLIHDVSTARRRKHKAQINWSRELAFSRRQINFIAQNVPNERGVYCIYAKDRVFPYEMPHRFNRLWNPVVYVGCGWLNQRLAHHLRNGKNDVLTDYLVYYDLAFRFAPIFDADEYIDYPRVVEAGILSLFKQKFGPLPPANRREENLPDLECDEFIVNESSNFSVFRQG